MDEAYLKDLQLTRNVPLQHPGLGTPKTLPRDLSIHFTTF